MKTRGLIHAMLKKTADLEHSPVEHKKSTNTQIAGLQFMHNEMESIKEGLQSNAYNKNECLFSFCNNRIVNSAADIIKTGKYQIETDSGVFTLDRAALIKEITFTQKIITTLLNRQSTITSMANMSEEDKIAKIKKIIKEDKKHFSQPGLFAKDNVKALAKGRYLIAAHMAKPHAFDSSLPNNKGLNRFVHIFFSNVKKVQAIQVQDTNVIAEHIGVITK